MEHFFSSFNAGVRVLPEIILRVSCENNCSAKFSVEKICRKLQEALNGLNFYHRRRFYLEKLGSQNASFSVAPSFIYC